MEKKSQPKVVAKVVKKVVVPKKKVSVKVDKNEVDIEHIEENIDQDFIKTPEEVEELIVQNKRLKEQLSIVIKICVE